jgi:hypothetical protein
MHTQSTSLLVTPSPLVQSESLELPLLPESLPEEPSPAASFRLFAFDFLWLLPFRSFLRSDLCFALSFLCLCLLSLWDLWCFRSLCDVPCAPDSKEDCSLLIAEFSGGPV